MHPERGLTPVDEALAQILADVVPLTDRERVPLAAGRGRVLAAQMRSTIDVPRADNSAVDGYAIRHVDHAQGQRAFVLAQRIPAGAVGAALAPGEAARIFTGADLPPGADTVVMQEDCRIAGSQVVLGEGVRHSENVRPRAQDIANGDVVLAGGTRLSPAHVALMASIGRADVEVVRRARVAIVATGDELVEPPLTLLPGQIYNSNRYLLAGLLEERGVEVLDMGIVRDDARHTRDTLREAASQADMVITAGGVSVGEEDHVKPAVEESGSLQLWKIAIKPGKPLAYGRILGVPFFGLPGNPASVFVTFLVITHPYLARLQGVTGETGLHEIEARADFEWLRPGRRQEYLRARLEADEIGACVRLYPNQSSGVLSSIAWANALAVVHPGEIVHRGDRVHLMML